MKHKFEVIPKEEVLSNRCNAYEFINFDKDMKQTAVEWLVNELTKNKFITKNGGFTNPLIEQAKEMENEQRGYSKEKVDKLLDKLLYNNMCSHAGDELIEQFKNK